MTTNRWQTVDSTDDLELPRPNMHLSTAEPVPARNLDDVVTAYPIGTSRSSERLTDLETAWPIDSHSGQQTPRGQVDGRTQSVLWFYEKPTRGCINPCGPSLFLLGEPKSRHRGAE